MFACFSITLEKEKSGERGARERESSTYVGIEASELS
jgi:hypothetical protein